MKKSTINAVSFLIVIIIAVTAWAVCSNGFKDNDPSKFFNSWGGGTNVGTTNDPKDEDKNNDSSGNNNSGNSGSSGNNNSGNSGGSGNSGSTTHAKHTFSTEWSSTASDHYHKASCGCDLIIDIEPHTFVNDECTVCGVKRQHVHTFSTVWSSDSTNHYHSATCGHFIARDTAPHTYVNNKCSVCGANKPEEVHTHTFETKFTYDNKNHWHKSTCGHAIVMDIAAHKLVNGVCSVCGYKHEHTYSYSLSEDIELNKRGHTFTATCECTDINRTEFEIHTYIGDADRYCMYCGYSPSGYIRV